MAKVHVVSEYASLYPLAHRLAGEGHDVTFYTREFFQNATVWSTEESANPRISFSPPTEAADFYLLDPRGNGGLATTLVRERKVLLGGCRLTTRLHKDPEYKQEVMKMLPSVENGEGETVPCVVFGFFSGERMFEPQGVAFYQSRLMEGERGPHLGVTGMALLWLSGRLASVAFPSPLTEFLAHASYRGPVHILMRVGPEALYYDDVDLSLSQPTLLLWSELMKGELYESLFNLSAGFLKRFQMRSDPLAMGVRLSFTPPSLESLEGDLLQPTDFKHLWPEMGATPPFLHIAWATARGTDLVEARRRVYRTIGMINPQPVIQYRRDMGRALEEQVKMAKDWGWM
ncbi:MAG: hypothetical protein ACWGQW_04755 [bacterium]